MKVRLGFVSNSSSSSFLIIGVPVSIVDLEFDKLTDVITIGTYIEDGIDVFTLTPEILQEIIMGNYTDFRFIRVIKEGDNFISIRKEELPSEELTIFAAEVDYHSTTTVEEFRQRYNNEEYIYVTGQPNL